MEDKVVEKAEEEEVEPEDKYTDNTEGVAIEDVDIEVDAAEELHLPASSSSSYLPASSSVPAALKRI